MTLVQALVLGILQGLAEFLPISSSAHLALAPWALGWPEPGLSFDVALHFGTLLAVLIYFRSEWARLAVAALQIVRSRRAETVEQRRALYLVVASIPGGLAGLALDRYAEQAFRDPRLIATMLIVMGIVLWLVDRARDSSRPLADMRWRDALAIGFAQVLALIPGVSRSGSTITAGRAVRFDRAGAATFSFLMSMPIIAAASILKLPHLLRGGELGGALAVGVAASALSGWLAIGVLMRYVTRHSYGVFAVYRVLVGVAVIVLAIHRG